MEIKTKKELSFFIKADRMMNRNAFKKSILTYLKELLIPDHIMDYLVSMRKVAYYHTKKAGGAFSQ